MQGPKDKVPRFRRRDGGVDRFEIAHFTDENNVRVLPQNAPQCFSEAGHVHADFTLGDDRLFMFVIKLDGVLDRDDVRFVPFFIDDIDHRGESSALSRTGRASDEDQPARLVEQLANGRRQADLFEQQKFGRNLAQHQPKIASFLENADAETRQFTEGEAKVSAAALAHVLDVVFGGDAAHQFLGVLRHEGRPLDTVQNSMHADDRRHCHADVQIGSALGDH